MEAIWFRPPQGPGGRPNHLMEEENEVQKGDVTHL